MHGAIANDVFASALTALMDTTFRQVRGYYLAPGTSLFETLATIDPAEASRPVSARCANLAAQVNHARFYLDVTEAGLRGEEPENPDWEGSWAVGAVDAAAWAALVANLEASYRRVLATFAGVDDWNEAALGDALAILAHSAYHLGEIRQALCTVKG